MRRTTSWRLILAASLLALTSVGVPAGGDACTADRADAYLHPAPVLSRAQLERFERVAFDSRRVVFPSLGCEWGPGPT